MLAEEKPKPSSAGAPETSEAAVFPRLATCPQNDSQLILPLCHAPGGMVAWAARIGSHRWHEGAEEVKTTGSGRISGDIFCWAAVDSVSDR